MTFSSSVMSKMEMLSLCMVMIGVYIVILALSYSGITFFLYPSIGMSLTLIMASFVGRMDFILDDNLGERKQPDDENLA